MIRVLSTLIILSAAVLSQSTPQTGRSRITLYYPGPTPIENHIVADPLWRLTAQGCVQISQTDKGESIIFCGTFKITRDAK